MSNLKYVNVSKKRLVGRSNQTVPPLCIDYSTLFDISFQFIDERNQIIPLDSSLSGFAFAGSLKMGDMSSNLLWLCQDFSIEDNTLTFHNCNTFTVPFMAQIKKKNTEVNIEISQMSLNTKKVWLRDYALCAPRVWVARSKPSRGRQQRILYKS